MDTVAVRDRLGVVERGRFVMLKTPGCAGQSRGTREAQQQAMVGTDDEGEGEGEAASTTTGVAESEQQACAVMVVLGGLARWCLVVGEVQARCCCAVASAFRLSTTLRLPASTHLRCSFSPLARQRCLCGPTRWREQDFDG